jgi:ribosomal protein S6
VIAPKNSKLKALSDEAINLKHTNDLFIPQTRQKLNSHRGVGLPSWNKTYAYLITNVEMPHQKIQEPETSYKIIETVPRLSKRDSRFLFTGTLDGKLGKILVDSGCTVNIISASYCKKHNIPTSLIATPIELTLANNASTKTAKTAQITLCRNNYSRIIDCFVSDIKYDMMLGTPWLESIKITDLEWRFRSLEFRCNQTMTHHRWNSIQYKEKSNLRRVSYNSPQEFTRNTQWCAVVDVQKLDSLDADLRPSSIEVMSTENNARSTSNREIEAERLSRVERVRRNNQRIIREHTASRKEDTTQPTPSSDTTSDISSTSAITSDGMYNYNPEK